MDFFGACELSEVFPLLSVRVVVFDPFLQRTAHFVHRNDEVQFDVGERCRRKNGHDEHKNVLGSFVFTNPFMI